MKSEMQSTGANETFFTKATAKVGVSQSALGYIIKEIGARLIRRPVEVRGKLRRLSRWRSTR
jgi:hypothetical protein